ncbi:MAG: hypothetical protein ABS939_00095 [Psychrobacillus sp.]
MEIVVPIDLTAEQKTVMAYFSIRQFLIVGPAFVITLIQLILFNLPFLDGMVDVGVRFLFFLIVNGITISLAFVKLERRDQYLSEYILLKFKFLRSQKVYTN